MANRSILRIVMLTSRSFYFCAVLFFLLTVPGAYAQQQGEATQEIPEIELEFKPSEQELINADVAEDPEITVVKDPYADGNYVPPTLANLSKLYWRLQIFNPEDNGPVDNFLRINECEIYTNFFTDDFEWQEIRKSTREMLKQEAQNYPLQFKVLVPIDLGRYNQEKAGFPVSSHTSFVNSRRIQIASSGRGSRVCGSDGYGVPGYPEGVILILNKPFTFDFVPVDEHVAQAFLLRKKYNNSPIPNALKGQGYQRLAYARMRVTFVRYQGNIRGRGGKAEAILYGRLDGIEIFEDPNEEMLLASIDIK